MTVLALLNVNHLVASSGYVAIFVLSVLQSCCVPTSSELTLGYAGVLAFQGKLALPAVIVTATAGEVVGAYLAWLIGRYGGRAFVERYGRYVLLAPRDLDRAEGWYRRHQRFGVLGSRLLPVIRNFVAVPAGVAEVPLVRFGVLTAVGSLVWDGAMALIGYGLGDSYTKVMKGFSDAGYLLGALVVAGIAVVVWHRWRSYRAGLEPGATTTGPAHVPVTGRDREIARPGAGIGRISTRVGELKVPARITAFFWAIKLLSTAMGESLSDALVHGINQYLAVLIGFVLFAVAIVRQLRAPRYEPWTYWFAVAMVAVFGTMAADVLHIGLHVPYLASSLLYLVVLVVVLVAWWRTEPTLSIHSITTPRRELFYWLTVLATFALGTAVGDLTATTFHLGYLGSGLLFIGCFAVPGLSYGLLRTNAVASFWAAYILTRPLGASFADWLGFGHGVGGLGLGHPLATIIFGLPIVVLVAYVARTRLDATGPAAPAGGGEAAPATLAARPVGGAAHRPERLRAPFEGAD